MKSTAKYSRRWRSTESGRATRAAYAASPSGSAVQAAAMERYTASPKGKSTRAAYARRSRLGSFGFTPELYAERLATQGGVCAICKAPPHDKRLRPDHDHASGKPRGLLCNGCNLALGHLKDQPARARRAAAYLEGWS